MIFFTKLNRVVTVTSPQSTPTQLPVLAPVKKSIAEVDLVRSYLRDIGRVPLLTNEQEITLGRQVQDLMHLEKLEKEIESANGKKPSKEELAKDAGIKIDDLLKTFRRGNRAKERMVAANLRLVVSVAKKYTKRNMELLDLIQEGTIGLVRGVEKFDPARGYKFSTYAYWWIRQGITRAIAEKSRIIRLPIHITEVLNKLKKGQRELSQQLARTPSMQELANYLDIPIDEVKELMFRASQPVSLESRVGDGEDTVLLDLLSSESDLPSQKIEIDCMKGDLEVLLQKLPELQNRVLRMRYGINGEDPMTLTGIGRILGISRDRVRNLERDGLKGLRKFSNAVEAYVAS